MSDMKLLFPNGEHGQVLIGDGVTRVGSDPDGHVVIDLPGIAARHCEISSGEGQATLRVATPGCEVSVNGAKIVATAALRPGDLLMFGRVQARVVAVETALSSGAPTPRAAPVSDSGATRVRMALPKYVLRGVSGAAFGKTYPVPQQVVIGRQQDCDISVPSEEISRRHASVKPTPDGLMVEDLGSSNGTYINGKRVQKGVLKPGDELRLDQIRFMLIAPGMEIPRASAAAPAPSRAGVGGRRVLIAAAALVAIAAVAAFLLLR